MSSILFRGVKLHAYFGTCHMFYIEKVMVISQLLHVAD